LDEVTVAAGLSVVSTVNHRYNLGGLSAGAHTVTPQSPEYLFVPASRPVSVGPDQVGVDFKAYHWNMMSWEGVSNGTMQVMFPGTNGLTYRLLLSSDLLEWSPIATNTMGVENYWEMFLPIGSSGKGFYRTVTP